MNCNQCGTRFDSNFCPCCGLKAGLSSPGNAAIAAAKIPVYKKAWFWIIAVLLVLSALAGTDEQTPQNEDPTTSTSQSQSVDETR